MPHFTTVHKSARKLVKLDRVRRLIDVTVRRIKGVGRVVRYGAADSSGFDAHHASRYFIYRTASNGKDNAKGKWRNKRISYRRYGKLMLIVSCAIHAVLAAVASAGPAPDVGQLRGVLSELAPSVSLAHMVADAGFDSAPNHRLLREVHGILSIIPAGGGRPPKDPKALPAAKCRRLMKTRFNRLACRQRVQVEAVFSMLKRNLGSALRGRSHWPRCRDMLLRVLTHNIMLIR